MGGYLSNYGAGTERRERLVHGFLKWGLIAVSAALIALFMHFFVFPNRSEQAVVRTFFERLQTKDYKAGYALFGCTDASPCRAYPMQSFLDDWGPGVLPVSTFDVLSGESCGSGVIVDVDAGKAGNRKLWVERQGMVLGTIPPNVAELGRCPQGNRIYDLVRDLKYRLHGRRYH